MPATLLALLSLSGYALCAQPSAPSPIAAPLRELPWAQLNFLHTTDVHGWWGGHLQEPSYSADWGDYISFAEHLQARADADGSDLLLIDTGDRVEGNAIYDGSDPKGKFTYDIAKEQRIDLICSGNHELYKQNSSEGEFYHTVPNFKGNYLASNLDIYSPKTGKLEPLARRYKKFKTKNQGIRILAFGFIFDFTGNANNTVIHTVDDTVKEDWFKEAIQDTELDLIIVFGHVDIRSHEYATLFSTIRSAQWDTPIQFFGGHTHIRDYKKFDAKSVALESGRYMETLGFMSIEGLRAGGTKEQAPKPQKSKLKFSRLYLDNNLFSLHHHSGKNDTTFPTERGQNVSKHIDEARISLGLTERYGCAPRDLWVNRRPYPHKESIFTWLEKEVLPDQVYQSARVKNGSKALVITNTGGVRFDIFQGPFTKDTTYLVSPFTSGLRYLKDVPYKSASRVLKLLNNEGPILDLMAQSKIFLQPPDNVGGDLRLTAEYSSEYWELFTHPKQKPGAQAPILDAVNELLIPGYTTKDDAGEDGDDTLHSPVKFYQVPNCIQAPVNFSPDEGDEPESVDLMYNEFIEKWVLLALDYLGEKYNAEDSEPYLGGISFTEIITKWVKKHWDVKGESCPE
ncbi:Metallo-dependent phosphatase-like protein [Lophiotrema nucula]|uniref:Metallo-dependent phosphatase-like protein n=1 Tax=Lophiotrema nucula TaxID=690887 RepID=A0A6A5ZBW5_9PLEO|nr:Metallo-dependent phosphatase-like protein [Lophiotrema nucula]